MGSFGSVYEAKDPHGASFAVKIETVLGGSSLAQENTILTHLILVSGMVPKVHYFGNHYGGYTVLVLDRLGCSLADLMRTRRDGFSAKTVMMIGIQGVWCLKHIHSRSVGHGDVKHDNMLMGRSDPKGLYMIDFGMGKFYRDLQTNIHIGSRGTHSGRETCDVQFGSINVLRGEFKSRRDDLESLAYVLIYLYKGRLPWTNLAFRFDPRTVERVVQNKESTSCADLTRGMPSGMTQFLQYVRDLSFESVPDYAPLENLLRGALQREGEVVDWAFDWDVIRTVINAEG